MSPDTAELVITHAVVTCNAESVDHFALLVDREQDITLHAEDQRRDGGEARKTCSERRKICGRVHRRWMGLGVGCPVELTFCGRLEGIGRRRRPCAGQLERLESGQGHVK